MYSSLTFSSLSHQRYSNHKERDLRLFQLILLSVTAFYVSVWQCRENVEPYYYSDFMDSSSILLPREAMSWRIWFKFIFSFSLSSFLVSRILQSRDIIRLEQQMPGARIILPEGVQIWEVPFMTQFPSRHAAIGIVTNLGLEVPLGWLHSVTSLSGCPWV